jgi:hypothetical protein
MPGMATSFISLSHDSPYGFWIHDALLQILCWGLGNVIDGLEDEDVQWAKGEYRAYLFYASQGYFVGFTTLRFDEHLVDDQRKNTFKKLLEKTKAFFTAKGEYLPVDELNAFQLEPNTRRTWVSDLKTSRILKVLDFTQMVVEGTITIKASDKIDYEF